MDQEIKQVHVWVALYYGILVPTKEELPPDVDAYFEQLYADKYRPTEGLASHLGYSEHDLSDMLKDVIGAPYCRIVGNDDYIRSLDRNDRNPVKGHLVGIPLTGIERDAFERDIDAMICSGGLGICDHQMVSTKMRGFNVATGRKWVRRAKEIGIETKCQLHLISGVQFFDFYAETDSEEAKSQAPGRWDM